MTGSQRYESIPQELRERDQWVCYRIEMRNGNKTKIPYQATAGGRRRAKSNDPSTWCTFGDAVEAVARPGHRFDGVGFMLSAADPFVFVDLDHVVGVGVIEDWAVQLIQQMDTYTEYSQSGTGIHIIGRARKPGPRCRTHKYPKFEIYDSVRLVVFTGGHLAGSPTDIRDAQEAVERIYREAFADDESQAHTPRPESGRAYPLSDQELIRRAVSADNGDKFARLWSGNTADYDGDHSAADMALCCMLAFWTGRDGVRIVKLFRQSGLMRDKWDERRGDRTYGEMTVEAAIRQTGEVYSGLPDQPRMCASEEELMTTGACSPESATQSFPLTDLGNAERLVAAYGNDLRCNEDSGKWLIWDGRSWQTDQLGQVDRYARAVIRSMHDLLKNARSPEERDMLYSHIKRSESVARLQAIVHLARHCPGVPTRSSDFDGDPFLLNCQNGCLDLRKGKLRPHSRLDLMTKLVPAGYDAHAQCPRWEQFLKEVFGEDDDLIRFVQKAVGYSLTGATSEQCFFILHGCGSNGKTVFLKTLQDLTGDYSMTTNTDTLMEKHGSSIPNDIARLKGARLVTASETTAGRRLAEGLLKQATGEDPITARFLHQEFFEFKPQFKIWLACNHLPRIDGQDHGMWRRIKLIPFNVVFRDATCSEGPHKDVGLISKLAQEFAGILRWAVDGCLLWQEEGLEAPRTIQAATGDYQSAMDVIGGFLTECCVTTPKARTSAKDLYAAYYQWCEENGERPESQRTFGLRMGERGPYRQRRGTKGRREWHGIGLGGDEDSSSDDSGDGTTPK